MCFVLFKLLLTKFHRLGSLNYKNLFLPVLKTGKAEIRVPALVCLSQVQLFCDPMDCNLPGSSVHETLQARILEWVAILTPGDLPDPRIEPASPMSPALAGRFFTTSATWEAWWSPSFSWFTHSLFTVPSHGRERKLWPVHPPIKAPVSPWGLHVITSSKPNSFPKSSAPDTIPLGMKDFNIRTRGNTNIQSTGCWALIF